MSTPIHRMPFGKHRGELLASIPSNYLCWVLRDCTNIEDDLRDAIRAELSKRSPAKRKAAYQNAVRSHNARPPGDPAEVVDRLTMQTIRLLLEGESSGDFARGPLLDQMWELVAETHAELVRAHAKADRQQREAVARRPLAFLTKYMN